jgi:hypothetical protein
MRLVKTVEDSQPFAARKPLEFNGIVFMLNPNSTYYRRMKRFCELIESDYPGHLYDIREFESGPSPFGGKVNVEKLAGVVKPDDVLCVLGGDGGFNIGINALKLAGLEVPMLAARGGNASVMNKITTGEKSPGRYLQILQEGRLATIRPMTVKIDSARRPELELDAGFCFAVGASARIVELLGRDGFRKNILAKNKLTRAPLEVLMGLGAIALSPEYYLTQAETSGRVSYEILISTVDQMAKGVLKFPIRGPNEEMYKIESADKSLKLAYDLGRAALARMPGEYIDTTPLPGVKPWELDFTVLPPGKGKLFGQVDGDGFRISETTHFNVRPSEIPFQVVTFEGGQLAA